MSYYILYPKKYGFAEGPLTTKNDVIKRLNMMNIDYSRRPGKWKYETIR